MTNDAKESKRDPRHEARRVALAILFEKAFHSTDIKESLVRINELYNERSGIASDSKITSEENSVDQKLRIAITEGVAGKREELDKIISATAPAWPTDQINKVDLIALRIAIWELLFAKNVPQKVAIDEAIEIAKEFGGTSSGSFVNGVLGTVVEKYIEGEKSPEEDEDVEA
ncbi:MAG TPA: transcription antitermination factor NusB [candidate division WWE3 bacterium]|uniref:Transcription antitermination protein NusB n=1 Tax=candidate division WWE3 bacterium TaxID=2053526 RepID=A0A7C1SRG2_UNCKA|nr:transcription antitermination factor NusB [candidate division WWE3 bacterium]